MQRTFGEPERVFVENSWHDGPRAGIADVHGVPHRFRCIFDEECDDWTDGYVVAPIDSTTLALEIEQYLIFADWRDQYDRGLVRLESHPCRGGIDNRWDELERELSSRREIDESTALRALAEFQIPGERKRYSKSGPTYTVRWHLIG